nr:hypothetical protein CFP56_61780 [Quercus suber]
MAEELEALWKKLSFTEEEADGVELGSGSTKAALERGKYCAILKVLTHRSVSLDALRKNLRMMWKLKKEMHLSEVEEDLFLVEFRDEKDKRKVMDMSPWSYEKQLVIIQDFDAELAPTEIELKWCPFWIQIFNLPLKSRTRETGYAIGSKLGEVLDVDVPDSGVHLGKCLRVRVRLDVTKRLLRGKRNSSEMVFQNNGELQYGAWLRGEPMRRGNRDFLSPGMDGGVDGRGAAGGRREGENSHPTVTEGADVDGCSQVHRLVGGKVNLQEGKAKDMVEQINEKAPDVKVAADEGSIARGF